MDSIMGVRAKNLLFQLALVLVLMQTCVSKQLTIPKRFKTEGKLFMEYVHETKTVKHFMAFSENVDLEQRRAATSIGYVSRLPIRYFSIDNQPPITVSDEGVCRTIKSKRNFVPELSWFVELFLPNIDLSDFMGPDPLIVGPTGLLNLLNHLMNNEEDMELVSSKETHRNVPCAKYSKSYSPTGKGFTITLNRYEPIEGVSYRSKASSMFSFTAKLVPNNQDTSKKLDIVESNFAIDYHIFDTDDDDSTKTNYEMDDELNIPLGVGCSEFLEKISPRVDTQSFSMEYQQNSQEWTPTFVAYDHDHGFMRKELVGKSVSIWDIYREIMYHIDQDATDLMLNKVGQFADHQSCAILNLFGGKLGPAFRPYTQNGKPLDILEFMGATSLAYLGKGVARNLPCDVYEAILTEPPYLFALTDELLKSSSSEKRDYLVQFFLLKSDNRIGKTGKNPMIDEDFRPVRIVLYRRYIDLYRIKLLDTIDIYSFSWSLDGWDKKGNRLFMASECFTDLSEQIKLETSLTFEKVHDGTTNTNLKSQLMSKRYKLEYHLTNDILYVLHVGKMHMIDYELIFTPYHVNLNMLIGDRKDEIALSYFGAGSLTEQTTNMNNQVVLNGLTESRCIATASLINGIRMAVYCPATDDMPSSCTSVLGQREPAFKKAINVDPDKPSCQAYSYLPAASPPETATMMVNTHKDKLINHRFAFDLSETTGSLATNAMGTIANYDISHSYSLIRINHYGFVRQQDNEAQDPAKIRSFDSISYRDTGDCLKICNLDVNCRSYSYCKRPDDQDGHCLVSSFDLRSNNVNGQLAQAKIDPAKNNYTTTVKATTDGSSSGKTPVEYTLEFDDSCNIYERDYLSMYRQTDEIIRIKKSLAAQFITADTTFHCAKQTVDLEQSSSKHHIAMFAYCGSTSTCLMDENLLSPLPSNSSSSETNQTDLLCRLYRKKYQTNFHVSPKVLKLDPDQQVELNLNSVEECARACWNQLGQICSSFDFCSPGNCLINKVNSSKIDDRHQELKANCLHYERDLVLDELHKKNLITKHQPLIGQPDDDDEQHSSVKDFFVSAITNLLVLGAFILGLVLGRQVNDKIEAVTIRRQSNPATSDSRPFWLPRSLEEASKELNLDASAIKLDVINGSSSSMEDNSQSID